MSSSHPSPNHGPTVAELDAAQKAAKDYIEADGFVRLALFGSLASKTQPHQGFFDLLAKAIQSLSVAEDDVACLKRVEPYLLEGRGVAIPGIGQAPTAHRLAFQLATTTRGAIWRGLGEAMYGEFERLGREVDDRIEAGRKIPKALKDARDGFSPRFQQWTMRTADPQTAEELAACWLPTSWKAIRAELGRDLFAETLGLERLIDCEHLRAVRAIGEEAGPTTADDDLQAMRDALKVKGISAGPKALIRQARIGEQRGRWALRTLEARGEYHGFARPRPRRGGA